MRAKIDQQLLLTPGFSEHRRAKQLVEISGVLDRQPTVLDLIHEDLTAGVRSDLGRKGLSADQVLRILILQRVTRCSFDALEFAINDSELYWNFCRIGVGRRITRSRIHANVHKVQPTTIEAVNRIALQAAIAEKVETVERTRTDATVTETNIHAPTDSSLLWDATRMIGQIMEKAARVFRVTFTDRRQEAKREYVGAATSANAEERVPHYKALVDLVGEALADTARVVQELRSATKQAKLATKLVKKLETLAALGQRVVDQTRKRVFEGKKVPSAKKVVSMSEPHTDIIVKDRHNVFYGHKVTLTTGASGLVLDCFVETGNPADSTLAVRSVQRLKAAYGKVPSQVAFDGGYASQENLTKLKAEGVKDVAFSKGRGLKVAEMLRDPVNYPMLRNFRAGIEAGIAYLKTAVGLRRCVWRGPLGFCAYVWGGVLAANLLTLARRNLA